MWLNRLSIHAWSVGVPGRPKCCAIAHIAMNSRVDPEVICGPLSLTARRMGRRTASSTEGSARLSWWAATSSCRPSSSSASQNATWTWVVVSSPDTISQIHLRVTRSMIVITATPGQRAKCVTS